MSGSRLVADIGGTNARFARADDSRIVSDHLTLEVADYATFDAALAHYLVTIANPEDFSGAAIAGAGPVLDRAISLTNCNWRISAADVSATLGGKPVLLFNDLEAVALALPHLTQSDLRWIGCPPDTRRMDARMLAVNVGTGFGAATVIPTPAGWVSCPSEAGHMTLDIDAMLILEGLCGRPPQFSSIENVLSGAGLVALYQIAGQFDAVALSGAIVGARPLTSNEIIATSGNDPIAANVAAAVTCVLGGVAGNLVLASAAWGGAYLCGSVAMAWAETADIDTFRRHFENKGKMTGTMLETPTAIILASDPALIGLAAARIP